MPICVVCVVPKEQLQWNFQWWKVLVQWSLQNKDVIMTSSEVTWRHLNVLCFKCFKIYNKSATRDHRFLFAGLARDKSGLHFVSSAWPHMTSASGRNRKCPFSSKVAKGIKLLSTMLVPGKGGQLTKYINDVTKCKSAL